MKHLIFYALIILLITVVSISKSSSSSSIEKDVSGNYWFNMPKDPFENMENIHLKYIYLKNHTMTEIEKNNLEIIQITEEIKEAQKRIELERTRRIKNLKAQNTKLNNQLTTYNPGSNAWENFKYNFSTNFMRMGLPFSELFPESNKE